MTAENSTIGDQSFAKARLAAAATQLFIVLAGASMAAMASWDGLENLVTRWRTEDEYGFGILAAALVPFLVWRRWPTIKAISSSRRWPGVALVMFAQLCGIVGVLGESYFIEQIIFFITLLGIAVAVFGTGPSRIFLPLTIILLLTVPLPYTLQAIVTLKLQLLSTDLGVAGIRLLGIPVFVEGNIIDLGSYKLQVAEACSGLRYLLPMTCISCILAYLYQAPFWKKAVVVASAPPVTVLINSFRIAIIGVLVDKFGPQMAEGFLHEFEGWIIFLLGTMLLGVEILALEGFRFSQVNIEALLGARDADQPNSTPVVSYGAVTLVMLTCAAAVGVTTSIAWAHAHSLAPSRETFASFPSRIGQWSGQRSQLEPQILAILKATDYYIADFSEASSRSPVNLFIAYYDSLSKGAAIHSPRVCLPGSGWEFASFAEKDFRELQPGVPGTFNRVVIQKGSQEILMYYWFQQRERRTANEFSMKYFLLVDSFEQSRRDGALVRIFTPVLNGIPDAEVRLQAFGKTVIPKLTPYLPQ